MRAILQSGFGPAPDVLSVAEVDRPSIGPADVLVRVEAVGIAKGNWLMTHGLPYIARPSYGMRTPKQRVAGFSLRVPSRPSAERSMDSRWAMPSSALATAPSPSSSPPRRMRWR